MLFKSGLVTQISGSFGGITGSHNSGGLYLRSRTIPVDPQSSAQVAARAAFASLSGFWFSTLTTAQRTAWSTYASNVLLPGPLGDMRDVGGLGMYIRGNVPLLLANEARVDDGPTIFQQGRAMSGPSFTADSALQQLAISIGATGASFRFQIQMGLPQNGSVQFFKGPWRRQSTNAFGDFPLTTTPIFPIAAGQAIFLRIRTIESDARLGPASVIRAIAT